MLEFVSEFLPSNTSCLFCSILDHFISY